MTTQVQITFRGMDTSPAARDAIQGRADKLERFADRITDCRVVVELRGHADHGIHVHVGYPGGRAESDQTSRDREDVYATIGRAFDQVERQLRDAHDRRVRL